MAKLPPFPPLPVTESRKPEEVSFPDRLADDLFVGREREMTELRAGLESACSGRGRLAEELRPPAYLWHSAMWKGMRALLDGRFEEGERLTRQALALGQSTALAGRSPDLRNSNVYPTP